MRSRSFTPEGLRIGSGRLAGLVEAFAAFGRLPGGGVSRLCGSAADGAARDRLGALLIEAGAEMRIDAAGNQFGFFRLSPGGGWDRPALMIGSHLDSQPRGGRIDGTLGVLAGLEVARQLMAAREAGHVFTGDLVVANWTNEEGARFRPSLMGSGAFVDPQAIETALAARDDAGISLREALASIGYLGSDRPPVLPSCYLELHAEQGRHLETSGRRLGIVTGNWGAAKLDLVFEGEQAHTGPTPMAQRRDALLAAAGAIRIVRDLADESAGRLHSSVGRVIVSPNSANVVADRVELTAEFRSLSDELTSATERRAQEAIAEMAQAAGVSLSLKSRTLRAARAMPEDVVRFLSDCAAAIGEPADLMRTVSGHDALSLLGRCPTGLVFVPSIGGIAHNEAEATSAEDMDAGANLLLEAAFRVCSGHGIETTAADQEALS